MPSALFADLLLPEVSVHMPEFNGKVDVETMGALQALKEFAPGRVTHRFAVGHTHDRLWIPPHDGDIPVDDYVESDPLTYLPTLGGESLRVYRPLTMRPINPPNNIANSSNARLTWLSDFHPIGRVETREPPPGGGWNSILQRFDFHLHQTGGRLVVHRVATGSNATVTESRETRRVTTRFVDSHGPVGLGVRMEVDAVRVAIKDPADWMATYHRDPVRSRGLRAAWFRETICRDDDLTAISSIFQRNWLAELACALVIDRSAATGDLREGSRTLGDPNVDKLLDEILTVVFQSIDPTSVTGDDAPDDELNVTKLHRELLVLAAEPAARKALRIAGEQLVDPSGIAFEEWLRDRFAATVAGAIVTAANLMDEEIVGHDLVVDGSDWHDGTATLTFCETHPGGIGVVERLFACLQQDPKRFWRTVATAVGPSDAEEIDARMTRIVNLACDVPAVAERFERLRNSPSNQDRKTNWKRLVSSLAEHGEVLSVGVNVALSLRILRAGTTDRTDTLLRDLLKSWSEIEERLGLELDQRVFAYLASSDSTLDDSLAFEAVGGERDRTWRFNSILSLLWQRGSTLREQPLRLWSPFDGLGEPERTLVAERLEHHLRGIDVNQAGVADIAAGELADAGAVEILAPKSDLRLKQVLLESLARPVEVGVLELYPRVVGAHRRAHGLAIELEIAEVLG